MVMLTAGIVLWIVVHLIPGPGRDARQKIITSVGEKPYKGVFSLALLAALALIVLGWRSAAVEPVYLPPAWGGLAALILMPVAIFLFGASHARTRVKRLIRHPQLTGLAIWSVAHLLANGDKRSVLLFGGLGLWALLEMVVINRRDGEWIKPEAPTLATEFKMLVISAAVFAILVYLHPIFAGVSALQL